MGESQRPPPPESRPSPMAEVSAPAPRSARRCCRHAAQSGCRRAEGRGARPRTAPSTFTHPVSASAARSWTSCGRRSRPVRSRGRTRTTRRRTAPTARCAVRRQPRAVVECGSYSQPELRLHRRARGRDRGVHRRAGSGTSPATMRYAQKSIELMDAWSATIRDHTNSNAPLQTGWAALVLAEGRRDHQARLRQLAELRPLRHDAAQRLPARRSSTARTPTATGS